MIDAPKLIIDETETPVIKQHNQPLLSIRADSMITPISSPIISQIKQNPPPAFIPPSSNYSTSSSSSPTMTSTLSPLTQVNPFVGIIRRMLSLESHNKYQTTDGYPVFGWSQCGKYLIIRNPNTLFSKMMADFFVTTNLSSFIRQLNHYNFTKVKVSEHSKNSRGHHDQMLVYEHPKFRKDNQCDLERKQKTSSRTVQPQVSRNEVSREDYNRILQDVNTLWSTISKMKSLDERRGVDIALLARENENLKQTLALNDERLEKLIAKIESSSDKREKKHVKRKAVGWKDQGPRNKSSRTRSTSSSACVPMFRKCVSVPDAKLKKEDY